MYALYVPLSLYTWKGSHKSTLAAKILPQYIWIPVVILYKNLVQMC